MNDDLQKQLSDYLAKTAGAVEKLVDFSAEQAPELAREIITYGYYLHGIWLSVTGFFLFIVLLIGVVGLLNAYDGISFLSFFLTPILFIAFCTNLNSFIQLSVAPRLYLIEQLASMISGGCK